MAKQSAGLVVFRKHSQHGLQVLLVHPGGPFWKNKEVGAWSIPKGLKEKEDEDLLALAIREFFEETGNTIVSKNFIELQPVKMKSGKVVQAWAVEADFAQPFISSNYFDLEWPPKSGKSQSFPEVDKADWFTIDEALIKINPAQASFLVQVSKLV